MPPESTNLPAFATTKLLAFWLVFGCFVSFAVGQESEIVTPRWQVEGELLLWWTSGSFAPPLVTTSPFGTPRTDAGVLGTPGAETLFGGEEINNGMRSGVRLGLSRFIYDDTGARLRFQGIYLGEDNGTVDYIADSTGNPILSRPFIDAVTNLPRSELVAYDQVVEGSVEVSSGSKFYGASVNISDVYWEGETSRVALHGGYRYLAFTDNLKIREQLESTDLGGVIPLGTQFDVRDSFSANNVFHGFDLGCEAEFYRGPALFTLGGRLALGGLSRRLSIDGATTVAIPLLPETSYAGGLLTQPGNIGRYSSGGFVAIPELTANLKLPITGSLSVSCGYNLMVIANVYRAAEQADLTVNTTQVGGGVLVGPDRPLPTLSTSDLWIHGVNLGLEVIW